MSVLDAANGGTVDVASPDSLTTLDLKAEIDKTKAYADVLREQMVALDARRERHMKNRPAGRAKSVQEVEVLIRQKQEDMERSSLTIKEEKAALQTMKRMKEDAKKAIEWESEMAIMKNKRSELAENMRQVYASLDTQRSAHWQAEAAISLQIPIEEMVEKRIPIDEGMQELLSTSLWKKRLRHEQGVMTKIDRGQSNRAVRFAGRQEAVDAAESAIMSLGPMSVRRVAVDAEQQSLLIGRGGSTITSLQESTGCSLEVKKSENQVIIAGPRDAVERAAVDVADLLEQQRRVEIIIKFDPVQKGTLLGWKGSTINRIQLESKGATLEIGKGDDCTVKVAGPHACVMRARAELAKLLFLDAKSVKALEVPVELLDMVMGKSAENVRRLESTHAVSIDRSRDTSGPTVRFKIRGSVDGVDKAKKDIEELVERERHIEESLEVESLHVGMLLGKQGVTINAIQRNTGAALDIRKKADEGSSVQTVVIRGNKLAVAKAQAALEVVLQYKAECKEVVTIEQNMKALLIGKGGEEITRIRALSGAAIDAEKHELKLRGSKESVALAKQAIAHAIDSNKYTSESVVLPWDCVDVLLGPNAANLKALESEHNVQVELPGANLGSDLIGSGSFLGIATSMTLRGRKKHVESATNAIQKLSYDHTLEILELDLEDSQLLARLCLEREELLVELGARCSVQITFEPLENSVTFRGEDTRAARLGVQQLLTSERAQEAFIDCPPTQMALLAAEDSQALMLLQQLCQPTLVALQLFPAQLVLTAPQQSLEAARAAAQTWVDEHAPSSQSVPLPPEVLAVARQQLPTLAREHRVNFEFAAADEALVISGAEKIVIAAAAAVTALVRHHALQEETLPLAAEEVALVQLMLRTLRGLNRGVSAEVVRGENKVLLKGTVEHVEQAKAWLQELLAEAEGCAVQLSINGAQWDKLMRPLGRERIELYRKLQDAHGCVLHAERSAGEGGTVTRMLSLRGRAEAVARVQQELDTALDVDEQERIVQTQVIPIIIGKGGSTIKRLQQESDATFDLDRSTGRVRVHGRKAAVAKACELLDELLDQFGGQMEMRVQPRQIPLIIGRGGNTIRQLQTESGASIGISKDDCIVKMRGSKQAVDIATQLLQQVLAEGGRSQSTAPGVNGGAPAAVVAPSSAAPPPGLGLGAP